jgi:hypothetical protein
MIPPPPASLGSSGSTPSAIRRSPVPALCPPSWRRRPVPAGSLCQSPLEAYCGAEAVCRVSLIEPVGVDQADLLVCSPCGERLWAEGSAGEPWECESGAAGGRCSGWAVVVAEAPGYGAAGAMNSCRPCAAVLALSSPPVCGRPASQPGQSWTCGRSAGHPGFCVPRGAPVSA